MVAMTMITSSTRHQIPCPGVQVHEDMPERRIHDASALRFADVCETDTHHESTGHLEESQETR